MTNKTNDEESAILHVLCRALARPSTVLCSSKRRGAELPFTGRKNVTKSSTTTQETYLLPRVTQSYRVGALRPFCGIQAFAPTSVMNRARAELRKNGGNYPTYRCDFAELAA